MMCVKHGRRGVLCNGSKSLESEMRDCASAETRGSLGWRRCGAESGFGCGKQLCVPENIGKRRRW